MDWLALPSEVTRLSLASRLITPQRVVLFTPQRVALFTPQRSRLGSSPAEFILSPAAVLFSSMSEKSVLSPQSTPQQSLPAELEYLISFGSQAGVVHPLHFACNNHCIPKTA